jgi:hypothetical protein
VVVPLYTLVTATCTRNPRALQHHIRRHKKAETEEEGGVTGCVRDAARRSRRRTSRESYSLLVRPHTVPSRLLSRDPQPWPSPADPRPWSPGPLLPAARSFMLHMLTRCFRRSHHAATKAAAKAGNPEKGGSALNNLFMVSPCSAWGGCPPRNSTRGPTATVV